MENLPIGIVDLSVIGILLISGLLAYLRGFVRELKAIFGWIGAILAAAYGYKYALPFVMKLVEDENLATIGAAVAVFVLALIVLNILTSLIAGGLEEIGAGAIDKALGFAFGIARGALIICIVYLGLAKLMDNELPQPVAEARSLPAVKFVSIALLNVLPETLKENLGTEIDDAKSTVDKAREVQETYEKLTQPAPEGEDGAESGYDSQDRQQLDELIKEAQ